MIVKLKLKDKAKNALFFFDFLAETAIQKSLFKIGFHFLAGRIRNGEADFERWMDLSLEANRIGTQKFVDAMIEHG